MKYLITILIFFIVPIIGYSQGDKFEFAISHLEKLNYQVYDKTLKKNKYHISTDKKALSWINESIAYCNNSEWITRQIEPISLEDLVTIKHVTVKSKKEIEPNLYPSAELIEVEFSDSLTAVYNLKILNNLTPSERECINKGPWTSWRIKNKLYFIITRATIFGKEIPKIQDTMNEKLI